MRHPCDLDLLVFFARHPRTVLISERLTVYVGYDIAQIARSLETLIEAGFVTRVQRPAGNARMYLLTSGRAPEPPLETLLRLASTREGRLAVLAALSQPEPPAEASNAGGPALRIAGRPPRQRVPDRQGTEVRYA